MTGRELSPLFTWRSAIADSDLRPTLRHVALTLSLHMNERGGSAYPSVGTLGRETGLSESTVRTSLRELEGGGWLDADVTAGGKGRTNRYRASIPTHRLPGGIEEGTHRLDEPNPPANDAKPTGSRPLGRKEDVIEDVSPPLTRQQRNGAWDALEAVYGPVAPHERSLRGKIARDLAIAVVGDRRDADYHEIHAEVERRARAYRREWPQAAFTDTALHRRWSVFAENVQAAPSAEARAARWVESAGWRLAPDDAAVILEELGLAADRIPDALLYRERVAADRRSTSTLVAGIGDLPKEDHDG